MAEQGGQPGNQNAVKGRRWRNAIEKALAKRCKGDAQAALEDLAEKFLNAVENGDLAAFRELGDRIDGKPAQAIVGGDEDDNPVKVKGHIELVRPHD